MNKIYDILTLEDVKIGEILNPSNESTYRFRTLEYILNDGGVLFEDNEDLDKYIMVHLSLSVGGLPPV